MMKLAVAAAVKHVIVGSTSSLLTRMSQSGRASRQTGGAFATHRSDLLRQMQDMRQGKAQCISLLSDSEGEDQESSHQEDLHARLGTKPDSPELHQEGPRQPLQALQPAQHHVQQQPKLRRLRKAAARGVPTCSPDAGTLLAEVVDGLGDLQISRPQAGQVSTSSSSGKEAAAEGRSGSRGQNRAASSFAAAVATPLPGAEGAAGSAGQGPGQHQDGHSQQGPIQGSPGSLPQTSADSTGVSNTSSSPRSAAATSALPEEGPAESGQAVDLVIGEHSEFRLPSSVAGMLYRHQLGGLKWLWSLFEGRRRGGILADDMGLGKVGLEVVSNQSWCSDACPIRSQLSHSCADDAVRGLPGRPADQQAHQVGCGRAHCSRRCMLSAVG